MNSIATNNVTERSRMMRVIKKYPYLSVGLLFFIVYLLSLTYVYVEGDDASTVAYHALGRNPDFQEPYSPYHGMMDSALSIFPANEPLLRFLSITFSALSALFFVILSLRLISDWLPEGARKNLLYFTPLLSVIVPELLFFGLIYMPSTLAMSLILAGHLVARQFFRDADQNYLKFFLSLALYGLGTSFRWDVAVYGIVIFADIFFIVWDRRQWNFSNLLKLGIWSALAIISVVFFIYLSGYPPTRIVEVITWAKEYLGAKQVSYFKRIGVTISLLTPAFILCFAIGLIRLVIDRKWSYIIVGLVGFLPKLYLGFTFLPKSLIMALPGIFLIVYWGFDFIFDQSSKYFNLSVGRVPVPKILFWLALALPWIIGIKIDAGNTAWGPGFEVNYKESPDYNHSAGIDNKISLEKIKPGISGGFAIPTPEGPRPLWGYAGVLLGGEWRKLVSEMNDERDRMINLSLEENLPILQNNDYKLILVNLLRDGYIERNPIFSNDLYNERTLEKNSTSIKIFSIKSKELNDKSTLLKIKEIIGHHRFICWFISSSDIINLKKTYPGQVQILGPFSARFDLSNLN